MTDPQPPHPTADRASEPTSGGEAVCWLARVCPECGRLADHVPPTRCARCGTELLVV